jgi:hypothetical protein
MENNKFNKWLDTFLEEKKVNLDTEFEYQGMECLNIIDLHSIIDAIKNTSQSEQLKIKNTIVEIDFKNGDVLHFFKHLGNALVV